MSSFHLLASILATYIALPPFQINKYLLKKVLDSDSKYQSDVAPIPRFPRTPNEPSCINFTGRVVSMLIKITDASYTTYSLEKSGWFMSDGTEVCGLKAVCLLRQAIGVYGLTGVDRLLVSGANLTHVCM